MLRIMQERLRDLSTIERNEEVLFMQMMASRMKSETTALMVWRAREMNRRQQIQSKGTASLLVGNDELNSALYPEKCRQYKASRDDERIDMTMLSYPYYVAPTDTYDDAIRRMDEKYRMGMLRRKIA